MHGNRTKSEQNAQRITAWRDAFTDDRTGIHRTIQDLLWNYAAFRTTIRIVRLANERRGPRPPLNQMIFNLVSEGFWLSLLLGTRRLLDKGPTMGTRRLLDKGPINGPKGVYSIRSVVKDVEACQSWLNRRAYVEQVLDARYDLDRLQQKHHEALLAAKGGVVWASPDLTKSEAAHHNFDILSGVSPSQRSASDLISPTIFTKIEARLVDLDRIAEYVSSHVAHAGNKQSREHKNLDKFDIRDAQNVLKKLKEIADLVGVWFANEGGAGLATDLGDQFVGLDHPLVETAELADLEEQWRLVDGEIAKWSIRPDEL
ncbi:hypothetical protein [Thalassospira sp.]|uniref:AbiU2 domain-containing protein n=1 Tax=Thalassospira sp. TaxID=1912094 RepID=UPI0027366BEC|nr:hypothetical protein [Thalassospira sp.]MDP2699407.1 hypothetical protein [Thalassospira sp.]